MTGSRLVAAAFLLLASSPPLPGANGSSRSVPLYPLGTFSRTITTRSPEAQRYFNQGLALSLRERYPAMYKDFRHFCQVLHPKPGTLWTWAGAEGVRIVNLLTQEPAPAHHAKPGRASVSHVNHALRELRRFVSQ